MQPMGSNNFGPSRVNAGATTDLAAVTLAIQVLEGGGRERRKWASKSEHLLSPSTQGRKGGRAGGGSERERCS